MKIGAFRLACALRHFTLVLGWFAGALLLGGSLIPAARAQELVFNGGFETGDLTGWARQGSWQVYPGFAYDGDYAPGSGCRGAACLSSNYISQTLSTTSGQSYALSLWVGGLNGPGNLRIVWDGTEIFNGAIDNVGTYEQLSFAVTATGSFTTFQLYGRSDPSNLYVDDVSVMAVPEPAAWALMIGGFGMIGGALRLRRRGALSAPKLDRAGR